MQNRHSFLSVAGKGWKVNQPVTGLHGVTQGSMSSLIHPMPVHVHHTQVTASASIRAVDSLCISRHSPWVNWTTAINTSIKHFLTKKFKKRFNTYLGFLSGLDVEPGFKDQEDPLEKEITVFLPGKSQGQRRLVGYNLLQSMGLQSQTWMSN